jgi:hypothetical protein
VQHSAGSIRVQHHTTTLPRCCRGGATHFDYLDMGVQPTRGSALLFFPSFAGALHQLHHALWTIGRILASSFWMQQIEPGSCGWRKRQCAGKYLRLPHI